MESSANSSSITNAQEEGTLAKSPSVIQKPILFHSVSYPRLMRTDDDLLQSIENLESRRQGQEPRQLKGSKHGKYVFYVLYYQRNSDSHYSLKKKKLIIGEKTVADLSDGVNNVHPMVVKQMQTRYKKFLVMGGGDNFDRQSHQFQEGVFLAKKFWQANLLWGATDCLNKNLELAVEFLKDQGLCNAVLTVAGAGAGTAAKKNSLFKKKEQETQTMAN